MASGAMQRCGIAATSRWLMASSTASVGGALPTLCGRGDKKTKKGKRFKGSYGNARPKKEKMIERIKDKVEVPSALGMCRRCGNLRRLACSRCKGTGSVKEGGILRLGSNLIDDLYENLGYQSKVKQISCVKCQARGYFSCPECSKQ